MSLVGTRPPTVDEWDKYELHHRARLATKPGLTGMWQVSGRSNITDFEEVVKLDKQYISEWTIRIINQVLIVYKDAAGLWHEDRFRPLCTALANLVMNLILVQFIGIYGILLSTVLSTLFIGMPWVIHNIFTVLFKTGKNNYVKELLEYTLATVLICIGTFSFKWYRLKARHSYIKRIWLYKYNCRKRTRTARWYFPNLSIS